MALDGKLLGVVGAGRIGREVGRRAAVFGMRVGYTARRAHPDWEADTGAVPMMLDTLLAEADVVSIHLALGAGAERIIDERALGLMKPGAIPAGLRTR